MDIDYNYYHIWDSELSLEEKIEKIIENNSKRTIFFAAEEHEISPFLHHQPNFEKLHFKNLDIVFGSFESLSSDEINIPIGARVHYWPTLWCYRTYMEFTFTPHVVNHSNITTTYLCLNNKAHKHRCMLIDELSRQNLLDYGSVSWHEPGVDYLWEHWKPEHLILDEIYSKNFHSYKSFPIQFNNTLFSLIAEATSNKLFITEKTWTPIFYKKPVLLFGAKDINARLESLGIELYTELFDYSFDSCFDIKDRLAGIIENVKKLSQMDLQELRNKIENKAQRNHERMIEIATSKIYIPNIVYNHMELLYKNPLLKKGNDWYFLQMYNSLTDK